MRRKMLVADLLCGAGGSSTGCSRALAGLGLGMDLVCVNHWGVAIDTHKKNHPQARHYVQDIATVRPHLLVPEGYLDLLMASPTCTHHSVARGGKPTSDQQRSDPWHIITWLTELRVKRLIIENVWEFTGWGPVDARTGKPIKSRKGEYFRAWIAALEALGFKVEWRKLNAADFGDATTRQRFILMGRSDGKPIVWPEPTHCKRDPQKKIQPLKPWKAARAIIDWAIRGKSIFGRKKPLAPKTLARILAGAEKFGWPEPYLVILRNHMAGKSLDIPLPTIAAGGNHIGLAQPIVCANRTNNEARAVTSPVAGITTGGGLFLAEPVIVKQNFRRDVASVDEPVPTVMTQARIGLVEPVLLSPHNSGAPRSAADPLPTITTGGAGDSRRPGCARPMLIEPFVLSRNGDEPGVESRRSRSIDEPIPTSTASGAGYLVEPFVLSRQGGGAPRAVDEPTPCQCAKHSHVLISPYYGSGSGETCHSADCPLPTVTSKGRFGMVVPITHADGSNRSRDLSDPLPTITTANRGELAFITAQHGERAGQSPRVHGIESPVPTIAATGHVDLAEAAEGYDILFRMLEPHELAAAMGFTGDDGQEYEFSGNKTQKIKQIGNAVSVKKMRACVAAIMADAASKEAVA